MFSIAEDFDPTFCSHGFYAFANVSEETWTIEVGDPDLDLDNGNCDEDIYTCGYRQGF